MVGGSVHRGKYPIEGSGPGATISFMLARSRIPFALLPLLGALLTGCGYRIPGGDIHPEDPFFPGLGGDSGFVIARQPLAEARALEVRQVAKGEVEITSASDLADGDSVRTLTLQRFDSAGRELSRHSRKFVAWSEPNPSSFTRCADGRVLFGNEILLDPDPALPPRRIAAYEPDPEWMSRTFGRSLEDLHDSLVHTGDSLDRQAGHWFFRPKSDSLVRRADSMVFAASFREDGVGSLHLVEYGSWTWVLGIDHKHRVVRSEHAGALANAASTSVRCSSLYVHPSPGSPLRAVDSSVITNSSSGNHYVFGFHPKWMTYHRVRLDDREARFKLYGSDDLDSAHVPVFLRGAATLPQSVWIVAGGSPRGGRPSSPDSLFLIRAIP